MSIYNSLYSGISGLNANGNNISIIGDNIANINTPGFKTSQGQFEDLFAQSLIGAAVATGDQIGMGSRLSGVAPVFTQGGLQSSGLATDMAINGKGFFVLNDSRGDLFYTRSGQFLVDQEGYMVNPDGLRVQGYLADESGNITGELSDIMTTSQSSLPIATTEADFIANLDAEDELLLDDLGALIPFDVTDPFGTSNFSTGITVYDSQGRSHLLTMFFQKTDAGDNTWDVHILASGEELGYPDEYVDLTDPAITGYGGTIELAFGAEGELLVEPGFSDAPLDIPWAGGVNGGEIMFDFGTIGEVDGVTQFGAPSLIESQVQDGRAAGDLISFNTNKEGIIFGTFSNGDTRSLAQIALAHFANDTALARNGGNLYSETPYSGTAIIGTTDSPHLGSINSSFLEQSNVDMAAEFVRLITSQRGYQANSRVITGTNTLLGELVNLVR